MEISLENLFVDVGGLRVKRVPLPGEMKGRDLNAGTQCLCLILRHGNGRCYLC